MVNAALYLSINYYIYLDSDFGPETHWHWKKHYMNAHAYAAKYEHPLWQKFFSDGVRGGHGGMDYLVYNEFFKYVINGGTSPIDVYDAAAWMCITPLSEISIREGSRPVDIPDFTTIK